MDLTAGVLRDPDGLDRLTDRLAQAAPTAAHAHPTLAGWEATNLHTVMVAITAAASARAESRGCHRRADHDAPVDSWATHLIGQLDGPPTDRTLTQEIHP